jgi:hypothetical protein
LSVSAIAYGQTAVPAQSPSSPAVQHLITKTSLDAMEEFIKARGYRITRDTKDNFFYFTGEGHRILVYVTSETSIELGVIFTGQVDLKDLNRFNNDNRVGAAYITNDGSILLDETIPLDGGITDENLEVHVFNFVDAAARLYTFLNEHVQKKDESDKK